jgi:hypothetical protein
MPCIALPRGITDVQYPWNDATDNNPCGKDVYAGGLCKLHWQMQYGLVGGGVDQFTTFLCHCDGPDGSTVFTDVMGHPITTFGQAKISAAVSKFGSGSLALDGVGDFISCPDSPDWLFPGDFTVESWINLNDAALANQTVLGNFSSSPGNYSWLLRYGPPGGLSFYASVDGSALLSGSAPFTPTVGVWYHVAAARAGTTLRIFIDGVQGGSFALAGPLFDSSHPLGIGGNAISGSWTLNGYIDEPRISKGIARWTSNFTPPTAPYA